MLRGPLGLKYSCPSQSTWNGRPSGYSSLAENLPKFSELGELPPTIQLERLDEGHGIEATMIANHAKYHHTCRLKYSHTKLKRAEKRALKIEDNSDKAPTACKYTRSNSLTPSADKQINDTCFFCGQPAGNEGLHMKQQHSNQTNGRGTVQSFLATWSCLASLVVET